MNVPPRTLSCVVPAAMLLLVVACRAPAPVHAAEVPGTYAIQAGTVHDTVDVHPDGTFAHRLWDGKFLAIEESGRWHLGAYGDGAPAIDFDGIRPFADRSPPVDTQPGAWLAPIERSVAGRLMLVVTRDIGLAYVRVETPAR